MPGRVARTRQEQTRPARRRAVCLPSTSLRAADAKIKCHSGPVLYRYPPPHRTAHRRPLALVREMPACRPAPRRRAGKRQNAKPAQPRSEFSLSPMDASAPRQRRLSLLVQGVRGRLDRRRARSRSNAGATGCAFDAPSPGHSSGQVLPDTSHSAASGAATLQGESAGAGAKRACSRYSPLSTCRRSVLRRWPPSGGGARRPWPRPLAPRPSRPWAPPRG
jgi:hypothetical protein